MNLLTPWSPSVFQDPNISGEGRYATQRSSRPTFRTPIYVFEDFLLDTHTEDDLPAKRDNPPRRILDPARREEQQGNRDHPSIRRSLRGALLEDTPRSPRYDPKAARTGCKRLRIIPIVLVCGCGMWARGSHPQRATVPIRHKFFRVDHRVHRLSANGDHYPGGEVCRG